MLNKQRRKIRKNIFLVLLGCFIALVSIIPFRIVIAGWQSPYPQAILVLGGSTAREQSAAQIAKHETQLDIWISSGTKPKQLISTFKGAGIDRARVHLDYRATDTVTNFTTLVSEFKQKNIQHLYLITSDAHMPRAKAIATIVLGSNGITYTPIYVPSTQDEEPFDKVIRDSGRSLLWVLTGFSGA